MTSEGKMDNDTKTATLGEIWIDRLERLLDETEEKYIELFCEVMARQGGIAEPFELFSLIEKEAYKVYDRGFRNWKWDDFKTIAKACDYFKEEITAEAEGKGFQTRPTDLGEKEARIVSRVKRQLSKPSCE